MLHLYSGNYIERNTVNLLFVSESGTKLKLFENDRLITDIQSARFNKDNSYILNKNLYSVVSQDSNSDGFLNKKDQVDLYVSDYNGQNLKLIFENINELETIGDNKLLVTADELSGVEIYIYHVISEKKIKLDISIE
ncbi:hypothetical protein [Aliikangiella sp. IMCC44359]|uniref:hypothetical protein n=1 Tax=Aliikangiella sp. IMCC44359 TaxID=3459125 RepID=UPI00403AD224